MNEPYNLHSSGGQGDTKAYQSVTNRGGYCSTTLPGRMGISMFGPMTQRNCEFVAEHNGLKLRVLLNEAGDSLNGVPLPEIRTAGGLWQHYGHIGSGQDVPIYVERAEAANEYVVYLRGEAIRLRLVSPRDERLEALRKNTAVIGSSRQILRAPMPGLLKAMLVAEGDIVARGIPLCILEAMKMENEIRSPDNLRVRRLLAQPGSVVEKGTPLVELEPVE